MAANHNALKLLGSLFRFNCRKTHARETLSLVNGHTSQQQPSRLAVRTLATAKQVQVPKKPLNAYLLFMTDKYPDIKKSNPNLIMTDISKLAGQMWRELPDSVKAGYQKKAEVNQVAYQEAVGELSSEDKLQRTEELKERRKHLAKIRKSKLSRQLGKPKLPAINSYICFVKDQLVKNPPKGNVVNFMKDVGAKWKNLSDKEKEVYQKQAETNKQAYLKELAVWESKMMKEGQHSVIRKASLSGMKVKISKRRARKLTSKKAVKSVPKVSKKTATPKKTATAKKTETKASKTVSATTKVSKAQTKAKEDSVWMKEE